MSLVDDLNKRCEYAAVDEIEKLRAENERLRAQVAEYERTAQEGHPDPCTLGPLCPYCEIERLKAQLYTTDQDLRQYREWHDDARAEAERLWARERLRAAQCSCCPGEGGPDPCPPLEDPACPIHGELLAENERLRDAAEEATGLLLEERVEEAIETLAGVLLTTRPKEKS